MTTIVFPGQGSQHVGMGEALFYQFPELTQSASECLGYSIEELCTKNPDSKLDQTEYSQPAIYVVNALMWLKEKETLGAPVKFFMGHSLGEYNALLAAGAFDFVTGLKYVKERGKLMGQAKEGGMLAVVRTSADKVKSLLEEQKINDIDVANYNSPTQTILSGPKESLGVLAALLQNQQIISIPLNVSAAFHSRYMKEAQSAFSNVLEDAHFESLHTPVIANVTARPYQGDDIAELLVKQIASPVQWEASIRYAMSQGETEFKEIQFGPRPILIMMIKEIEATL